MKIALVGSSGYISGFIIDRLKDRSDILKIDKNDEADAYLDLENAVDFDYDKLNGIDYVIFPAAISSPDLRDAFSTFSSLVCAPRPRYRPKHAAGIPCDNGILQSVEPADIGTF